MKKIEWLDAMRGFAAIWVLSHHAVHAVTGFLGDPGTSFRIFLNGFLGVDFFFILSGFIIAMSTNRLISTGRGISDYLAARCVRIYVPYLPVGVAMLLLYMALPGLSHGDRESVSVLTTFTLLPSNTPPALSVAWTLVHEMIFYAVFTLFFISRRALNVTLVLWSLLIGGAWLAHVELIRFWAYFLSPINLCFVLGVVIFVVTQRGVGNRVGAGTLLLGSILLGSQAFVEEPNHVVAALGFAGLITASLMPALQVASPGRVFTTLGAASYAIYLIHNPALSFLARALRSAHLSPAQALLVIGVGAVVIGLLYHFLYERYALRWVRQKLGQVIGTVHSKTAAST